MQTGYKSILDMIDFYQCITADDDKAKYRSNIWNALYALRSREGGIPGGSTSSTSTAGGVLRVSGDTTLTEIWNPFVIYETCAAATEKTL
jgi:hypothetical protein